MDLSSHSALGSWHHHWRTLGPMPHNLHLICNKTKKNEFFSGPHMIGFSFKKKDYEKSNCKNPRVASLEGVVSYYKGT